jgi:hypothetical protein
MAIRMRRGSFNKFDPAKMLAGELAVVLDGDPAVSDGKALYVCFAAGDVKRVATWEDAAQLIAAQLPDVIDMAVTSGTEDALAVETETDEGGKTVFEVSHVAKASDATEGLDPFAQSAGDRPTLGTTTLADGNAFWVPCVSVDRFGHVTGISYRKFTMPTTGVASLTKLGKVIPDGETITIDNRGMISSEVPDGTMTFRGVVSSDADLPEDPETGDLYVSGGIAKMWDGETWRAMGGGGTYELPTMSAATKGGAKVGSGLSVTGDVLSVDVEDAGGIPATEKGAAGGVAELDANGIVLSSQLPSYVDDVLEYASRSAFPTTGEAGKIYVALDTNLTYRWAGSTYTEISPSLALGETSSTAYRGDRGKVAYEHAQAKGSAFSSNLYKITTNAEGHVTAATPATSADIVAFLNGNAIAPSSVAATGVVSGSSVSDSVGSLADLRDSVSQVETLSPTASASTGVTVHRVQGYQLGKVVMLRLQISTSETFSNNDTLAQITGLPAPKVEVLAYLSNTDADGMTVAIDTNLVLKCAGGTSKNHSWAGATLVYLTV